MDSPERKRILDETFSRLDDSGITSAQIRNYLGDPAHPTSAPEPFDSPPNRGPGRPVEFKTSPPTGISGLTSAPEAFKSPPTRVPMQKGRPVKLKTSPTPSPPSRRVFKLLPEDRMSTERRNLGLDLKSRQSAARPRKNIPASLRKRIRKSVDQKLPEDENLGRAILERQSLGLDETEEERVLDSKQMIIQQADILENQRKEITEIKAQVADIHEMVVLGMPQLLKNVQAQNENARVSQFNQSNMGDRLADLKDLVKTGFRDSRHLLSNHDCLSPLLFSPKKLLECILRLGMFLIRSFVMASWSYFEYVDRLGIFLGRVNTGVPLIGPAIGEVIIQFTRIIVLIVGVMFYFAMLTTLIGRGHAEGGGIVVKTIIKVATMLRDAFLSLYASCGALIEGFGDMLEAGGALEHIQALKDWSWNMTVSCKNGIVWFISEAVPAAGRETAYAAGRATKAASKFVVELGISGVRRLGAAGGKLFTFGKNRLGWGTRKKKKKDKGRTKRRKRGHRHKTRGKRNARRRTSHAGGKIEIQRLNDKFNSSKIIRSIDSIVMNDIDANYSSIDIIQGDMEMFYMVLKKTLEQAEGSVLSFIDTMKFNKKITVSKKERAIALKETPRLINNAIQVCLDTFDPKLELIDASNEEILLYIEDTMPQPE